MKRFTTQKLINMICENNQSIVDAIETSDSIIDQANRSVPIIADDFAVFRVKTNKHSWLSKEEHARQILCEITKTDYELISFKRKQLDDIIFGDLPF